MGAACCGPYSATSSWNGIESVCLPNTPPLNTKLAGGLLQDLEDFRDEYLYVLTTIPDADLPKPSTLFSHLIDELDKCPTLKPKVEKARESKPGSHRRTTEWLWNRVDIALELQQQKIIRQEFDRTLKGRPQVLTSNTQLAKGSDPNAAPAALTPSPVPAAPAAKERRRKRKRRMIQSFLLLLAKEKAKVAKDRETPLQELLWEGAVPHAGRVQAGVIPLQGLSKRSALAR